jgi:CRISPR-associated exonuclease Cas4
LTAVSNITATHVKYLHVCPRKLWLFGHDLWMEHTSEAVADGTLLGETSYADRARRYTEITVLGSKIDFFDPHEKVVHEVKRGNKVMVADRAQVRYYIWLLEQVGVTGASGLLEYPRLRRTEVVEPLDDAMRAEVAGWAEQIRGILAGPCPTVINKPICKECAYYEFCYAGEA